MGVVSDNDIEEVVRGRSEFGVTIRKSCGARPDIYGLTCALTFSNHTISEYLQFGSLPCGHLYHFHVQIGTRGPGPGNGRYGYGAAVTEDVSRAHKKIEGAIGGNRVFAECDLETGNVGHG